MVRAWIVFVSFFIGFFILVSFTQAALPGDANSDGAVDGVDYSIWHTKYNQSTTGAANGDFDGNGFVDGPDYVIWLNNYGKI